jgi:hypothetical protein
MVQRAIATGAGPIIQADEMNVVKFRKFDISPNLDSIEADRMLIEQTASYIKDLRQQINAAEMYIAHGREFKNLHGHLSKNSRHDKSRIGWYRAFSAEENKFGLSRQHAESYITIYTAFFHVANAVATWRLPQSLKALHALAKLKLTADQIQARIDNGSLTPDSTETDIRNFIARKKPPQPITKNTPKNQRIQAALKYLNKLGLTIADLKKGAAS